MRNGINLLYKMRKEQTGRITIPLEVVKETERTMSVPLYSYLMFYSHPETHQLIASRRELMRLLGCKSTRPVDAAINDLEEKGFIERVEVFVKTNEMDGEIPDDPDDHEYITEARKNYRSLGSMYKVIH